MKKILVLGSSGQIGSHLSTHLKDIGHEVVEFDILENLNNDLRLPKSSESYIDDCDFVYFAAFDVGGSKYLKKYQHSFEFIDNNMRIMLNVFNLLRKYKKPFIFFSTQMVDAENSAYGLLKAIGEQYTTALGGIVVRLWNVYGVELYGDKSHVITDFILSAKNNNKIEMLTDGNEERQLLHVEDCCECLTIIMNKYRDIPRSDKLHITSFDWIKIHNVADIVSRIFDGVEVIPSNDIDHVQYNNRIEPSKDILQYWSPKLSLEDGILNVAKSII